MISMRLPEPPGVCCYPVKTARRRYSFRPLTAFCQDVRFGRTQDGGDGCPGLRIQVGESGILELTGQHASDAIEQVSLHFPGQGLDGIGIDQVAERVFKGARFQVEVA